MMLMIGTTELARQIYDAWRKRMDVIEPMSARVSWEQPRPRSKFEHLTTNEQNVWRGVAEDVGRVMADAMGALPATVASRQERQQ